METLLREQAEAGTMSDTEQAKVVMIVKGLKSKLSKEEMTRRYLERLPKFREVPGLLQKFYSYDESTQTWAGIYVWDSTEALAAYKDSDLRATIPTAYELTEPPQIEVYPIVDVLRR
ncbi:MAG: YdhR family protein [Deltaproteobacteria bacterium]|jgi:heme-degrading monooxygenase HmoA|nr:YdhR family protein [Deltaproteobacteria bacterium]MBW2536725.1 YdhR family protein [Deltaproteobacteria bacterium]